MTPDSVSHYSNPSTSIFILLLHQFQFLQTLDPLFSCSAITVTPVTSANSKLQTLTAEFNSISEPTDRVKRLIQYASQLPQLDDLVRVPANRVMGCMAQVWLDVRMDSDEMMRFLAHSDSEITKGFSSCLISVLDGATTEEVLGMKTEDLRDLNVAGLHGTKVDSRVNTWKKKEESKFYGFDLQFPIFK
ncbi:putative Fe-S metabolism associated domain, SufE [Helianthus debilis subsp. tardiflorus]